MIAPVLVALAAAAVCGQLQWTMHTPALSPSARTYPVMAYDAARQRVVMVGLGDFPRLNDTWEWDGTDWAWGKPPTTPQLTGFAMAYDAARRLVVLYGGSTFGPSETWVLDGVTWKQRSPATSPPSRTFPAMAYDAVRQRVVLFGGSILGAALNDTWEWDGVNWIQQWPTSSPPARTEHAMAYDAARQRVILFGGKSVTYLNDTWIWQGSTWIPARPSVAPSPRHGHAMAYDATIRRVVLFGGTLGTVQAPFYNDTWAWDGSAWVQHTPLASPPTRAYHAMACHAARQRIVVFGGMTGPWPNQNAPNDTWEYAATNLVGSGTPRPGGTVSLALTASLDPGRPYQIGASFGTGPLLLGALTLGLDLDHLLAASVAGALPGIFQGFAGALDSSGRAAAAIRIPPVAALVGADIHTAFVTLGPGGPPGIRSVSNTESFKIVP